MLLFIGFILVFFYYATGAILILCSIPFFLIKQQIDLNTDKQVIRVQNNILGKITWGKWLRINSNDKLILLYEYGAGRLNSRGKSTFVKTKTFTLKINANSKTTIFYEFTDYIIARKTSLLISNLFKIKLEDSYSETLKKNKDNRH